MTVPRQALVLCAGEGRRLRPLTARVPKPLVPFLNVPLLEHILGRLAAAGVERALCNAFHLGEQLVAFAAARPADGLRVEVIAEPRLLGTGGGVAGLFAHARREPVLVLAGDIVTDVDLAALARRHAETGARATMALTEAADPAVFGAVETDADELLTDIVARLGRPGRRARVNASVHLLEPDFVDRLPVAPSCLVRDGYLPLMAAGGRCAAHVHRGAWAETGTPSALLDAQAAALEGRLPVDPQLLGRGGARRAGPALVHPEARVAPDARLTDGTVVGPRAEVGAGAELVRCLVLADTVVPAGTRAAGRLLEPRVATSSEGVA